jgi:hypothetical protein
VEIIEHAPTLTDQPQQSATGMMVFRVGFEMLGQLFDASGEKRNLHFRRAAIVSGPCVVADNGSLAGGLKGHQVSYSFPFLFISP